MPDQAWDALEVARLQRAAADDSYREDVLREKGIVRTLRNSLPLVQQLWSPQAVYGVSTCQAFALASRWQLSA